MITEDQLEQFAIQWFQDPDWNYVHVEVVTPEGAEAEREDGEDIAHRTPNIEHRSEERRCWRKAVIALLRTVDSVLPECGSPNAVNAPPDDFKPSQCVRRS